MQTSQEQEEDEVTIQAVNGMEETTNGFENTETRCSTVKKTKKQASMLQERLGLTGFELRPTAWASES